MNQRKLGILISYLNIVLHALIGFAYVPILLHFIGKSEYGLYQLIGSFNAYFSVMDFGLTAAVVRFYTKYKTLQDKVNMENILAITMRAYAVITLFLFFLGCGCALLCLYSGNVRQKHDSSGNILGAKAVYPVAV